MLGDLCWLGLVIGFVVDMGVLLLVLCYVCCGWVSLLLVLGCVLCLFGWCLDLFDDEVCVVFGYEFVYLCCCDLVWCLLVVVVKVLLWL